jgi:C2H2 type zinc finger protein
MSSAPTPSATGSNWQGHNNHSLLSASEDIRPDWNRGPELNWSSVHTDQAPSEDPSLMVTLDQYDHDFASEESTSSDLLGPTQSILSNEWLCSDASPAISNLGLGISNQVYPFEPNVPLNLPYLSSPVAMKLPSWNPAQITDEDIQFQGRTTLSEASDELYSPISTLDMYVANATDVFEPLLTAIRQSQSPCSSYTSESAFQLLSTTSYPSKRLLPPARPSRIISREGNVLSHQCPQCGKPFRYGKDVVRHIRSRHDRESPLTPCPVSDCERNKRGFSRKDKLKLHIQRHHKSSMQGENETPNY